MVAVAAETVGIDAADALAAMGQIEEVAGRFATRVLGGVPTRLMLAKNPAGWSELLDLVAQDRGPLVVSINARTADGADPSWLWDVPFERLAGRAVVATGDRCADLSVRLHYADVAHLVESDPLTAVHTAATMGDDATPVDDRRRHRRRHWQLHGLRRAARGTAMRAPLRVVVVYPDLLGTYGDGGNGLILTRRAQWRGIEAELAQASSDAPLPEADIYCLGGGEDGPQVRAARALIDDRTLVRRVDAGAVVLAVCAGYQIVGTTFPGADGTPHEGVGLLGLTTSKGVGSRAVGEVTAEVTATSPCTGHAAHVDRLRKPWRCHHVGRGHHAPGPGDARCRQRRRFGHRGRRHRSGDGNLPARAGPGPQSSDGRSPAGVGPRYRHQRAHATR